MSNKIDLFNSSFGVLIPEKDPDENVFWSGNIKISNQIYIGNVPIFIFTVHDFLSDEIIIFVEKMIVDIDLYLEKSILFLKKTLFEEPKKYNLTKEEVDFLSLDNKNFPVDCPELIFRENEIEWDIRFSEGKFSFCDPFGVLVKFKDINPVAVFNLEDNETF